MSDRIIPLLVLTFPNVTFYYSTMDINVKNFKLNPYRDSLDDDHKYIAFKPYLLNNPTVTLEFDVFNPRFSYSTINIDIDNRDNLHDYSIMFPLESCDVIYAEYDYIKEEERFRLIGKLSDIEFNRNKVSFTIKDIGESIFIDQPALVLAEDTFQTIHTFGPFDTNPLGIFGLLVDIYNPNTNGDIATPTGTTWPVVPVGDDMVRSLVIFIEHESLFRNVKGLSDEENDLFWVGSLVSVIEDSLSTNSSVERASGPFSPPPPAQPYLDWPSETLLPIGSPLKSNFCLGASAYVLRAGGGNKNARWTVGDKRGRIWFDVNGPGIGLRADWELSSAARRIDTNPAGTIIRRLWENRTVGAKLMGNLAQRHIIRIWRRGLPENIDSVGQAFPIVYGNVKKLKAIHAIGGKAIGDAGGAGNDYYIFCCHPMAFRVVINRLKTGAINDTYLEDTIQFAEVKLWHDLDQFVENSVKAGLPYIRNSNEFGAQSNNPFPRRSDNYYSWNVGGTGPGIVDSGQLEPCVMWFNAGESNGARYQNWTAGQNRQIELFDNKHNNNYSGIRLRGDEYWADVSITNLNPAALPDDTSIENEAHPQYWIRNGLGSSNLYVDLNGNPDYDDGFITGIPASSVIVSSQDRSKRLKNPAGMLSNPADIIAHYLLNYTKLNGDKTKINWPSFRRARGMLFNWQFAVVFDDATSGEDNIGRLLSQCRCVLYKRNDQFYLQYIDLSAGGQFSYLFNDSSSNQRERFVLKRHGVGNLYNKFTIKFANYRPFNTWGGTITYSNENHQACSSAEQIFGATESFEFECKDVNKWNVAKSIADYLVELYTKPRLLCTIATSVIQDNYNLWPGKKVVLQSIDLPNRYRFLNPNIKNITPAKISFIITKRIKDGNMLQFDLLQIFRQGEFL